MQKSGTLAGSKNKSDSRKDKEALSLKSSDARSHPDKRLDNQQQLPKRFRNVPDIPDRYRNRQDKPSPDAYRNAQGKSSPDGYRNAQGKSSPDGYRNAQGKSSPDGYRNAQGKSSPDGYRNAQGKSSPKTYANVQDKSAAVRCRNVQDKSLPTTYGNVQEKSFPDRYRNVPDKSLPDRSVTDKKGSMQPSFLPSHSSHKETQSQHGTVTSSEFTLRSPPLRSPVLRSQVVRSPILVPPLNVQPFPMSFMLQFPRPNLFHFPQPVASYQAADMADVPFYDFNQFPSNFPQPPWDNYQDNNGSSFCFNSELEPQSSYSYWTDETVDQSSDGCLAAEYALGYSDTSTNSEYDARFFAEPSLVEFSGGSDPPECLKDYFDNSSQTSVETVLPYLPPRRTASQVPVTAMQALAPRGIVSRSIRSFFPHCAQTKTAACQSEIVLKDASTDTSTTSILITTGTNTDSDFMVSVGTCTETAELTAASTNTDEVEIRTVATNTELCDVVPATETTDPDFEIINSESGAKLKTQSDSVMYTDSRNTEDETVDYVHPKSIASSSSDVISNPECCSRQSAIQKGIAVQGEGDSWTGKLHFTGLEETDEKKRNLMPKTDLDEIYYSDDSSASEIDETVIKQKGLSDRSILRNYDLFPKWPGVIGTGSSSVLQPASTGLRKLQSPDMIRRPDFHSGNVILPQPASPLPGSPSWFRSENQKFLSPARSACSDASGLTSVSKFPSSLPFSCAERFPDPAGDASFVNTVLAENAALTRQIMTMLLKVNPLFALDPQAHQLAAFKELVLVKRCQIEMKILEQGQKAPVNRLQHQTSWNDQHGTRNSQSTFGKTAVTELQLSENQLDQCMQQARVNPTDVQRPQQNRQYLQRQQAGWLSQYPEEEQLLQKQSQQHIQSGQSETCSSDLQMTEESCLKTENEKSTNVNPLQPPEDMAENPFSALRYQRRLVYNNEANSSWMDRFARQKVSDWPQSLSVTETQNEEHNSEKITELSQITVEDISTKSQGNSDEETWQKVCRKKRTVRTLKETGPKRFSHR